MYGKWIFWAIIFCFIGSMALAQGYNPADPNLKEYRDTEATISGIELPQNSVERSFYGGSLEEADKETPAPPPPSTTPKTKKALPR